MDLDCDIEDAKEERDIERNAAKVALQKLEPLVPPELDVTRKYLLKQDIKRKYTTPLGNKLQAFEEEFYNPYRKDEVRNQKDQKLLSADEKKVINKIRLQGVMA